MNASPNQQAAKDARDTAFETTVRAAGQVLNADLAAAKNEPTPAGREAARRAAWDRYGAVQDAAGKAYRAAQRAARSQR